MPRNSGTVKAVNLCRAKSKAKVVEWETRVHSQGVRDVPVEVSAMESRSKPRKGAGRRPRAESNDVLQGESAPQSMDVNKTFWEEEPVTGMPTSEKRVRQPACPSSTNLTYCISHIQHSYIEDFTSKIGPYLRCLLDSEGVLATTIC